MGEEEAAVDTNQYDGPEDIQEVLTEVAAPEVKPEAKEEPPEPEAKKVAPLTPEQQEIFNAEVGKKVAKQREAERQAQEYQQQLAEAQQRLQQYERPIRPDIPAPPDPYEDNFREKVAHRDAMIAKAAEFDAQIRWQQQQEQARQQQTVAEERAKVVKTVESYSETASKLGITAEELQAAGAQIAQYIPDNLALRILKDPSGPELTLYLSRNLVELDKVTRMDVIDGAIYLENVIKPKAKRNPPTLAPEPTDKLSGAGMKEGGRGPKGVEYF